MFRSEFLPECILTFGIRDTQPAQSKELPHVSRLPHPLSRHLTSSSFNPEAACLCLHEELKCTSGVSGIPPSAGLSGCYQALETYTPSVGCACLIISLAVRRPLQLLSRSTDHMLDNIMNASLHRIACILKPMSPCSSQTEVASSPCAALIKGWYRCVRTEHHTCANCCGLITIPAIFLLKQTWLSSSCHGNHRQTQQSAYQCELPGVAGPAAGQ